MDHELQRLKFQLGVLTNGMEKLVELTKEQCLEQAEVMEMLWKKAFYIHDTVHHYMTQTVNELRCEQMENHLQIRKLTHQFKTLKRKVGAQSKTKDSSTLAFEVDENDEANTLQRNVDTELTTLTQQLLEKDQELLAVQQILSNLSVWFPHFEHYSNSLLTKLLPPVAEAERRMPPDRLIVLDVQRLEQLGLGITVKEQEMADINGPMSNISTSLLADMKPIAKDSSAFLQKPPPQPVDLFKVLHNTD